MGRKTSADVESKRKPVKVRPIERECDGEVTPVYAMLEELIDEHHAGVQRGPDGKPMLRNLDQAKFLLAYRMGWSPDLDNRLIFARVHQATDREKYEYKVDVDFVIELNEEVWSSLSEAWRRHILDHELCHAAPDLDKKSGNQKINIHERLCWRKRNHPIQEFYEIVERYGVDACLNLNAAAIRAAEDSERPLLAGHGDGDEDGYDGSPRKVSSTLPDEVETSILHLSNQGLSMKKIAAQTGVSERRVRTVLGKL